MRIRKNAKKLGYLYTNTNITNESLNTNNNLCQLNQNPWDIITFPSQDSPSSLNQFDNYEVCYNVNYAGNGSPVDSIEDFESVALKTSWSGENNNVNCQKKSKNEKERIRNATQEEIELCDKLDDQGWQCGSVVTNGNTMCDYHLSDLQNYDVWTTKKKCDSVSGPANGSRPRRYKKRPTPNPLEFYYYTGFGPSWGKKRGTEVVTTNGLRDDMDIQEEEGMHIKPEMGPMELDYLDDDDNEDDHEKGKVGITRKKKGRKLVKERSLKSLM